MKRTNVNGGVRCSVTGCRAWSMRDGSNLCAGHNPVGQALARAAIQSRRVRLVFPELDSTANAREWMKVIGQGLVSGQIRPSKGRETQMRLRKLQHGCAGPFLKLRPAVNKALEVAKQRDVW